jgi:hypothetical protein
VVKDWTTEFKGNATLSTVGIQLHAQLHLPRYPGQGQKRGFSVLFQ